MQYVTLVNRSSKTLVGTWDGRQHNIVPGKNSFPETMAKKFKEQNPVMGSEDPISLERLYLCGIEEEGDDCTPIEQTSAETLVDLKKFKEQFPEATVIKAQRGGLYAHEKNVGLSQDTLSVKP